MDLTDIIQLIHSDRGLTEAQKQEMTSEESKKKLATLLSGGVGAGLGLALAKYKKMSTTAQALLSALGFGAGVLIYKYYSRDKFLSYNDKTKTHEF